MSNVIQITDADFEREVLQSDIPVLLDFWATWCSPCRAIAPILDDLSEDFSGKIKIVKLNIDANPNTTTQFGIRQIPTLLLFKNGEVIGTQVGSLARSALSQFIEKSL